MKLKRISNQNSMSKSNSVILLASIFLLVCSCQNQPNQVSKSATPQADFYQSIGITKSDSIVKNIVDLKGNYRLYTENNAFEVDITIEFKEGNESIWITKIGDSSDKVFKKYQVFADALYLTHDLEVMKDVIKKIKSEGGENFATGLEKMTAQVPEVDKFRIKLLTNDTIQLIGNRNTINLLKID